MIQNIEDQVGRRPVTERELQDQRKNSPYMLMSYVLARSANAEDWFNGVAIGQHQTLELHHIFPKGLLRDHYDLQKESRIVDQVANLAFLSNRANSRISNSLPSEYLPKIDEQRLKAQQVPIEPAFWEMERFEDFLRRRREMLASDINRLLQSLSDQPAVWTVSEVQVLEDRVDVIERWTRDLIDERLSDAWGNSAWKHCVPKPVQNSIESRLERYLRDNPFEADKYELLHSKLLLCQFSDYPKIIRANWSLFDDVFGNELRFDQHIQAVIKARNAFKHNRELNPSSLASAEAGLLWLEDCLRNAEPIDETSDEEALSTVN